MEEAVGRGSEPVEQVGVGGEDRAEVGEVHPVDAGERQLLGAPEADQARGGRIGDVEDLEVPELGLDRRRDIIVLTLGEEPQVVDADVDEPEGALQEQVDVVGLDARQEHGVGRVADVVDLEAAGTAGA